MKAAQLRQSILQAAVQGKLVPQDPHDEPAVKLLERIGAKKAKLIKEGKKEKPLPPISEDEVPYDLPDGWTWCRIGHFCSVLGGKRIPKGMTFADSPTAHIYIRITDMKNGSISDNNLKYIDDEVYNQIKQYIITSDDLYVTIAGTIGQCGIVPEKFNNMNLTENAAKICNIIEVSKQYLVYAVTSCVIQRQFTALTNQMAQPKLALMRILSTVFPLPPLAEQQRIAAKTDELMTLCDELESAEKELDKLESRFAEYLPKSILQAAVQGRLVPQNIHDEPAAVLLKRIMQEKALLAGDGKAGKPLPPISEGETPFELPEGWVWCRLGDIHSILRGITFPASAKTQPFADGAECRATTGSVQKEYNPKTDIFIPEQYVKNPQQWLQQNENIMPTANSRELVGKTCMWKGTERKTFGGFLTVIRPAAGLLPVYSYYVLPYLWADGAFNTSSTQTTNIANINNEILMNTLMPLPPLAEQQRIVAKLDALLTLCDEVSV